MKAPKRVSHRGPLSGRRCFGGRGGGRGKGLSVSVEEEEQQQQQQLKPGADSLGVDSTLLRMTISYRRVPARRAS